MRIAESTIEHILARTDIVDVINTYVRLKKAGKSYTACCPFHQEKSPSFHVNREKGFYHCFGCGVSGNAIGFLMAYESKPFLQVMEGLASKAGVELPKFEDNDKYKYPKTPSNTPPKKTNNTQKLLTGNDTVSPTAIISTDTDPWGALDLDMMTLMPDTHPPATDENHKTEGNFFELLENVAAYFEKNLKTAYLANHYLESRSVNSTMQKYWRLGYAPEDTLHLAKAFPQDIAGLTSLGLLRTGDNNRQYCLLRDRLIFPIRNRSGKIIGFAGRALNDEVKPKYINSPESAIFHKSDALFGMYEGLQSHASQWLMVEGYLDVITLHQAGIYGAVASMGTATNENHLQLLFRQSNRVTLAFDGDAAGQKAAWRTLEIALPTLTDGRELRFLVLPEQHDPDSLLRKEGKIAFEKRINSAPPLSDFLYATLQNQHNTATTEGKNSLLAAAQQYFNQLPNTGNYKKLLQQTFKERLGLGWRGKAVDRRDNILNFEQSSLEDKVLVLILQYPSLIVHLTELESLLDDTSNTLVSAIHLIKQSANVRPEDSEQSLFFLLGAWQNPSQQKELCARLINANMVTDAQTPEQLDGLCHELALKLTEQALVRKMATLSTLRERNPLNTRLQEIRHQLQFRTLTTTTPL